MGQSPLLVVFEMLVAPLICFAGVLLWMHMRRVEARKAAKKAQMEELGMELANASAKASFASASSGEVNWEAGQQKRRTWSSLAAASGGFSVHAATSEREGGLHAAGSHASQDLGVAERAPAEQPAVEEQEVEEEEEEEEVIYADTVEQEVTLWIERLSGNLRGDRSFGEWLHNGEVLCEVANVVQPGIIRNINRSPQPFKQMENITNFIEACRSLGVLEMDVFSTIDLYEEKNLEGVMICVRNLASVIRMTAPKFRGPYLGVAQTCSVVDVKRKVRKTKDLGTGLRRDVQEEIRSAAPIFPKTR